MSFSFAFGSSPASNLKTNFIANFGSYAQPFNSLDPLGNQKFNTSWPIFFVVISVFLMIAFFHYGKQIVDPATNQPIEKTTGKKILTGLAWLLLATSIFGTGYGIYLYFAIYMPQYVEWFESLPLEAKTSIGMISAMDKILSQANRTQAPSTVIKF